MTRRLLAEVRSPLVLFVEHDTPLTGEVDWPGCARAVLSGAVNLVRFHHEASVLEPHKHLMVDEVPRVVEGVPLLRTVQWSQRPHLAATGSYRNWLEAGWWRESDGMIEDRMHGVVENDWLQHRDAGRFRLSMCAPEGDIKRSTHLDGRGRTRRSPSCEGRGRLALTDRGLGIQSWEAARNLDASVLHVETKDPSAPSHPERFPEPPASDGRKALDPASSSPGSAPSTSSTPPKPSTTGASPNGPEPTTSPPSCTPTPSSGPAPTPRPAVDRHPWRRDVMPHHTEVVRSPSPPTGSSPTVPPSSGTATDPTGCTSPASVPWPTATAPTSSSTPCRCSPSPAPCG